MAAPGESRHSAIGDERSHGQAVGGGRTPRNAATHRTRRESPEGLRAVCVAMSRAALLADGPGYDEHLGCDVLGLCASRVSVLVFELPLTA